MLLNVNIPEICALCPVVIADFFADTLSWTIRRIGGCAVNSTQGQLDTCVELNHLQKVNSTQVNSTRESTPHMVNSTQVNSTRESTQHTINSTQVNSTRESTRHTINSTQVNTYVNLKAYSQQFNCLALGL